MKECSNNIQRIAINLTKEEFKGYCKAMSLHWLFKSIDNPKANINTGKRVKFWDCAYERFKYNCNYN